MNIPKKVLAAHDLSGYGRCALSVIIPVLSAMGIQPISLPSGVLSTHLGGFTTPKIEILTEYMLGAIDHYKSLGIEFDAFYSGFLFGPSQIEIVSDLMSLPCGLKLVDPVMGDGGKPYSIIDDDHVFSMRKLIEKSDIITPNLTEASLLLGIPYNENPTIKECQKMLEDFSDLGIKETIITGVNTGGNELTNFMFDGNTFYKNSSYKLDVSYPGTGDIFASVYLGSRLLGFSSIESLDNATHFTKYCVSKTFQLGTDPKLGVILENCLDYFLSNQIILGGINEKN